MHRSAPLHPVASEHSSLIPALSRRVFSLSIPRHFSECYSLFFTVSPRFFLSFPARMPELWVPALPEYRPNTYQICLPVPHAKSLVNTQVASPADLVVSYRRIGKTRVDRQRGRCI
jgi:hypothetical protein